MFNKILKFIDFEKTKFKFIDFEKTKFKFIDFETTVFKFIDFEKTVFKFIDFEKTKIQIHEEFVSGFKFNSTLVATHGLRKQGCFCEKLLFILGRKDCDFLTLLIS